MDRLKARAGNDGDHRAAQPSVDKLIRILISSRDSSTLEILVAALTQLENTQIDCTSEAGEIAPLCADQYDLAIVDVSARGCGLKTSHVSNSALIVVCNEASLPQLVRAGFAGEILLKPISPEGALDVIRRVLRLRTQSKTLAAKYRRMRELVRRVVRERREINRRVELVCRDLVEAHRQLTRRFLESHKHPGRDTL